MSITRLIAFMVYVIVIFCVPAAAQQQPLVLNLKSASLMAIKTSPQLASANASADISKAEVGKAQSSMHPSVSAETGYSYLTKKTVFGGTPVLEQNTQINRVGLQHIVYSGGQLQAAVDRAKQGYVAASMSATAAKADILTYVAEAYFRARQAKENIDVANSSVQSLEASYDAAQKLNKAGVVTKSDVLRAQVALTSAKENQITACNNYNVALAALRSTIGLGQDCKIELASDASDTAPDFAEKAVMVQRPELASGIAAVKAAEADKKEAKAGRLPTVALTADFYNQPVGAQFPRLTNTLMAGVLVKMNIFDGGLTRSNIAEANASIKKANQDLEAQKRQIELEQQTAKLDLDSAKAKVETTSTQVQSADESLRVLQKGYKEGISPLTDVLTAETALTEAKTSRLAAVYDVKIAQVNLLRAYGQTDVLAR